MNKRLMVAVAIAFAATLQVGSAALAGEGGAAGCGCAANYAPGAVYYASPVYTYMPPTITVVPHYLVQPNYVVHRAYVLRPTRIIEDNFAPCGAPCEQRYVVDQGQFQVRAGTDGWTRYPPVEVRPYSHRHVRMYYGRAYRGHQHAPARYDIHH
jgi:hypothetical protein